MASLIPESGFTMKENETVQKILESIGKDPLAISEIEDIELHEGTLQDMAGEQISDTEEMRRKFIEAALFRQAHDVDLGAAITWQEYKLKLDGLYVKTCTGRCYARFSHPRLDEVWSDTRACAFVALGASVLTAIYASPKAALPAFKEAFYVCMIGKSHEWARRIKVSLYTKDECGRYTKV